MTCTHGLNMDTPCVKCALANGAGVPFDESLPPVQSGTHAPSSLISDLNASVDPEDAFRAAQLALQAQLQETADLLHYGPDLPRLKAKAEGRAEERARIRAIVMRLMGNEWSANRLIEEIDRG